MDAATVPFIQQLRNATASQHTGLEALPLSKVLMSENVTLKDYAHYLVCMKGVMELYDTILLPQIDEIIPHASLRKKLDGLAKDLKYLIEQGIPGTAVVELQTPPIQSEAFALGMAYVIEGSTLGGRVILKHLSPRLGVTEIHGAIFFAGYGNETGPMWKQFLEALTQFASSQDKGAQVIEGAVAGFDMISAHFVKNSEAE